MRIYDNCIAASIYQATTHCTTIAIERRLFRYWTGSGTFAEFRQVTSGLQSFAKASEPLNKLLIAHPSLRSVYTAVQIMEEKVVYKETSGNVHCLQFKQKYPINFSRCNNAGIVRKERGITNEWPVRETHNIKSDLDHALEQDHASVHQVSC